MWLADLQDLLCDLEVWHEAPGELLRSHLEHLYELAAESSEKRNNMWIMRELQVTIRTYTPDDGIVDSLYVCVCVQCYSWSLNCYTLCLK